MQLSSTTQDEALLPGSIIPDGNGGVLATWTISPVSPPIPQYPYQAVDVVAGVEGTPYNLPFSPTTITAGISPTLVLGEGGVAFASNGTTNGPVTASFNIASGSVNWTYLAPAQDALSLIVAATGNGIVAKTTDQNGNETVLRLTPSGVPSFDPWTGINVDYFVGDLWTGMSSTSPAIEYSAPLVQFSTSGWYSPGDEGSNKSTQAIHVTNASTNSPNQTVIASVLGKILTSINANTQSACATWLQGSSTDASELIQGMLNYNNFGHGVFNIPTKGAFSWGVNPDNTPTGIPSNYAITVNDDGAFFSPSFVVGAHNYPGNTLKAQATILIHEMGHLLSHANSNDAVGFQDDFGQSDSDKRAKNNDRLVDHNCKALIEGLQ